MKLLLFFLLSFNTLFGANFIAIVMANTNDDKAGFAFDIVQNNLIREVKTIAHQLGTPLILHQFDAQNFDIYKILDAVDELQVEEDDIVLLFTAHGYRTGSSDDQWPTVDFPKNFKGLNQKKFTDLVHKKNPRLLLSLFSCCNNKVWFLNWAWWNTVLPKSTYRPVQDYAALFLAQEGVIMASASEPGQYTWLNTQKGCFFMNALFSAIHSESGWEMIFLRAQQETIRNVEEACGELQVPQFLIE